MSEKVFGQFCQHRGTGEQWKNCALYKNASGAVHPELGLCEKINKNNDCPDYKFDSFEYNGWGCVTVLLVFGVIIGLLIWFLESL